MATRSQDSSTVCPSRKFSVTQVIRQGARSARATIATVSATGVKHTYSELLDRVSKLGTALTETCKVGMDASTGEATRCAILALNSAEYYEYFFGVCWAGAWVVPLNTRLAAPEFAEVLNDCTCEVLFVDETFAPLVPKLKASIPTLKHVIYMGQGKIPDGCLGYEDLIAGVKKPIEAAEVGGDDVFGLFYTGGTTGRSKGVMLTHTGLMSNAYSVLYELQYRTGDSYLHVAPMFHLADGASTLACTLAGCTHHFLPKFIPQGTLDTLTQNKVSHVLLVPTMITMALAVPGIEKMDFSSLKVILYGASPMPEAVLKQAMQVFGCDFVQGYGLTETSPVCTFLTARDHQKGGKLLSSCGRAVPHSEIKVCDQSGREVPTGEVGELYVRGPHVMKGYYRQPELTAKAITNNNGWFSTGDGACMDANGYVYIRDRLKDMVVSGGENVYSVEVEQVLQKIEGVSMCAVIGTPHEKLVEQVTAIIVPKHPENHNMTKESVIAACRENLAGYKCPKIVVFRDEPLPLSGAGKILKTELRKPFWENTGQAIYSTDASRTTSYS